MKYELPKMLKKARKARGLSLTDLDRATKISRAYLSQLETGYTKRPSFEIVHTLAKFFGMKAETLYFGNSSNPKVETQN